MKERLDILLVNKGLAPSREKAKAMIMEGNVFVDNNREDKAGSTFDVNASIEVKGNTLKYVSRVYAVDVGYGQFAWKLRQDERVVCMEKTNIRYVKPEDIADRLDFASVDVSFISLTKVLGPARELLNDNGEMVCLIKPQFEAGREKVGKKGVVRDKAVHEEVIHKVIDHAVEIGFHILNLEYSPIKGPEGNIEYLVYIRKEAEGSREESVDVHAVVEAAHGELDK